MSNPARQLHVILESWAQGADAPATVRALPNEDDVIQLHIGAMRLVWECQKAIGALIERQVVGAEVFLDASYNWARFVLMYPNGFNQANSEAEARRARLDMLMSLGILLDGSADRVRPEAVGQLSGFFNEVMEALKSDPSLDPALRSYLVDLVGEARRALDVYEATGHFPIDDALRRLWVAFFAAAEQSEHQKSKWRKFADKLHVPTTSGVLASLPTLALTALTGG